MSRRRALLELAVSYTLILLVIWTANPLQRILYITAVIVLAAILILSFQGCDKLGLRRTNLLRSLWVAIAALVLAAVLILVAAHLHTLHAPHTVSGLIARYWGYALWAFVQQILLQDVFLRRLLILTPSPRLAAFLAALIFAIAHLPNPILVPITFLWGFISCLLFLHYRNIIPLAIAHAAFGITLAITIPSPLIRNMRVGLGFLRYGAHHHRRLAQSSNSLSWQLAARSSKLKAQPRSGIPPDPAPFVRGFIADERVSQDSDRPHRSHIDHTVSTNVWVTAEAPMRLS
ncbi:MAG TPA: CPBP family glutamic-type intramembrane protease [Acidobacteriaceae bacterium]|nr:CPBP family glutamic-type intramembrane protease [Acidobacteriaceae bacterium]